MPNLHLSGVPPRDPNVKLLHSANSPRIENWKKRKVSLFIKPPAQQQQDLLLYVILDHLCARPAEDGIRHPQQRHALHVPISLHPLFVRIESFRGFSDF